MKAISLSIDTSQFNDLRQIQSRIIRMSYKLACNGFSPRVIELKLQDKFTNFDGHLFRSGVKLGWDIYNSQKRKSVVFGGKDNFRKLIKGKITKDQWKQLRLMPLYSIGQANVKGNRKFRLTGQELIFKDKNQEIRLQLPKLQKNWQQILNELMELSNSQIIPLTYKIKDNKIDIIYDEVQLKYFQNKYQQYLIVKNCILGIDLNPQEIGVSIIDNKHIIHTESFKYTKELSNDKIKNEISHIADAIAKLCRHYKVEKITIENLTIKLQNHKKGIRFNRLVNNKWNRTRFISKLQSICNIFKIKLVKINPAYSSFIGNLNHPQLPDSQASATEIARRGLYLYQKNYFYPRLIKQDTLVHRWKEMANVNYSSWTELYTIFKNLNLPFRSPGIDVRSYRFISRRSNVLRYVN